MPHKYLLTAGWLRVIWIHVMLKIKVNLQFEVTKSIRLHFAFTEYQGDRADYYYYIYIYFLWKETPQ